MHIPVIECTVVMRPSTMPNLSWITWQDLHPRSIRERSQSSHDIYVRSAAPQLTENELKSNLCQWSKTIGSATSVGHNINVRFVFLLIDTHNKHGSIATWSRNDNLLCTTLLINQKTRATLIAVMKIYGQQNKKTGPWILSPLSISIKKQNKSINKTLYNWCFIKKLRD